MNIALGDLSYYRNQFNLYVPLNIGYLASAARAKFGVRPELHKEPVGMLEAFLSGPRGCDEVAVAHRTFLGDLSAAIDAELYDLRTLSEAVAKADAAGLDSPVDEPIKIQPVFAARLAGGADAWVVEAMRRCMDIEREMETV